MSDGPYCPDCGEPVSATSSYCMHCYADLDGGTADAGATGSDDGETADSGDAGGDMADPDGVTGMGTDDDGWGGDHDEGTPGTTTGDGADAHESVADVVESAASEASGSTREATESTASSSVGSTTATTGGSNTATGGSNTATGGSNTATGGSNTATGGSTTTTTGGSNTATGGSNTATGGSTTTTTGGVQGSDGSLLDPEGMVDNSLTVVVGLAGSLVIGLVGTFVLVVLTGSLWGLVVAFVGWLVSLAYLVRQYSVQAAVSRTLYGVALVLLLAPFIAVGPSVDGGLADRAGLFVWTLLAVVVPAGIAGVLGYVVSLFEPEPPDGG